MVLILFYLPRPSCTSPSVILVTSWLPVSLPDRQSATLVINPVALAMLLWLMLYLICIWRWQCLISFKFFLAILSSMAHWSAGPSVMTIGSPWQQSTTDGLSIPPKIQAIEISHPPLTPCLHTHHLMPVRGRDWPFQISTVRSVYIIGLPC